MTDDNQNKMTPNEWLANLTNEEREQFIDRVAQGMREKLAADEKHRQEFKESGIFFQVLDRVHHELESVEIVMSNEYDIPLLAATDKHPEVTNEDFVETVNIMIFHNGYVILENYDDFPQEVVRVDGYEYGVCHGQGSVYWVEKY